MSLGQPAPAANMTSFGHPPSAFVGVTEAAIYTKEGMDAIAPSELNPFNAVKRLLWIRQNTVYSVALDEWEGRAKLLSERLDRMERRSGDLKNEVYQLVGFFAVFQGVVLTAVTQLTQSNGSNVCKKVWSPVVLTIMAWVVAVVGVWQKLSRIQMLDDECSDEDEARRDAVKRAQKLRNQGDAFKFKEIKEKPKATPPKTLCGLRLSFWIRRFGVTFVALSVFTGVFIASYFLILCDRGLAPIH